MAFIEYEIVKIYNHYEVIAILAKNILNSSSGLIKVDILGDKHQRFIIP